MQNQASQEQTLFQIDSESEPSGSLSDYIAKHLMNRDESLDKIVEQNEPQADLYSIIPNSFYNAVNQNAAQQTGRVLNQVDSQLANSQMERYLPTPTTRYQMMKSRITKELEVLHRELSGYKHLDGAEYYSKIQALETRIQLLEARLKEADQNLSSLNPFQSLYQNVKKQTDELTKPKENTKTPQIGFWKFVPNQKREVREEIAYVQSELSSLQKLMADHLDDPCFTPQQLSRLINQYDANLRKAERLMATLKEKQSLATAVSQWYQGLMPQPVPTEMESTPEAEF